MGLILEVFEILNGQDDDEEEEELNPSEWSVAFKYWKRFNKIMVLVFSRPMNILEYILDTIENFAQTYPVIYGITMSVFFNCRPFYCMCYSWNRCWSGNWL